jgi:hypothetical protein
MAVRLAALSHIVHELQVIVKMTKNYPRQQKINRNIDLPALDLVRGSVQRFLGPVAQDPPSVEQL